MKPNIQINVVAFEVQSRVSYAKESKNIYSDFQQNLPSKISSHFNVKPKKKTKKKDICVWGYMLKMLG